MPRWSLDDPQIEKKIQLIFIRIHCFVINEYLEHEFNYVTYLESKISIRAFDCLNITSVSLLGCPFVPEQGP